MEFVRRLNWLGRRRTAPLPAHRLAQLGVGLVPQGRDIFPLLTVRENMETAFACLPRGERRIPAEIFDLFPALRDMADRRGGATCRAGSSNWPSPGR